MLQIMKGGHIRVASVSELFDKRVKDAVKNIAKYAVNDFTRADTITKNNVYRGPIHPSGRVSSIAVVYNNGSKFLDIFCMRRLWSRGCSIQ